MQYSDKSTFLMRVIIKILLDDTVQYTRWPIISDTMLS